MQNLTIIIFILSEKVVKFIILPYTDDRPAGRPNTDHCIDSHFSCESKTSFFFVFSFIIVAIYLFIHLFICVAEKGEPIPCF